MDRGEKLKLRMKLTIEVIKGVCFNFFHLQGINLGNFMIAFRTPNRACISRITLDIVHYTVQSA